MNTNTNKHKHAFLIMAHHKIQQLSELIHALDYDNNDIYVHIDKKCKDKIEISTKKANLYFINSLDVKWGGYSQINCELKLLEEACSNHHYLYYHLLTGVSFPIKSNSYIHNFFKKNLGIQFVGFDNNKKYDYRTKYIYLFNEIGKPTNLYKKFLAKVRNLFIIVQKVLKINRFKKYNMICKKGFVYWSITDEFARYLLSKKNIIYKMCKHSLCGDEVFVQTILYNSKFRDKVYNFENEFDGCLRICPWETSEVGYREGFNFKMDDIQYLVNSKYLFALKFENKDGPEIERKILEVIKKNEN